MAMLTVIVPTFNRADLLARAVRSLLAQETVDGGLRLVVVDNNSSDRTRQAVDAFGGAVDYVFEPRQGLSHARNAGLARAAGSDLVAFTDDDVEVSRNWAPTIVREFENHPGVDCIGGRVLPSWQEPPPSWLTRDHWGPLALQDHGDQPREFSAAQPVCLVGANVAFRRAIFNRIGEFAPEVQRVKDGIGSTEDHDLLRRLYAMGGRARYVPDLLVTAVVPPERLTFSYHRRWHMGHGRFHAVMRIPEVERSPRGRLFGVPGHLYRTAASDLAALIALRLRGDAARAFTAETRLWFFGGFLRERCPLRR
jgi:glycosyltransferase involved in cell wall biosynthesis